MPITVRKPKAAVATRKTKTSLAHGNTKVLTRDAISAAVRAYLSTSHHALFADLMVQDDALAALFAEIDRNLDASEQRTARLLAA